VPLTPTAIRLIALLGAPAAWTLHLLGSYGAVAVACMTGAGGAGIIVGVITTGLAALSIASGLLAFQRWRLAGGEPHGEAERVLMVVGMLGAGLFSVAIVLEGVVPIFLPICA
jgi:hypothetical protein